VAGSAGAQGLWRGSQNRQGTSHPLHSCQLQSAPSVTDDIIQQSSLPVQSCCALRSQILLSLNSGHYSSLPLGTSSQYLKRDHCLVRHRRKLSAPLSIISTDLGQTRTCYTRRPDNCLAQDLRAHSPRGNAFALSQPGVRQRPCASSPLRQADGLNAYACA
jgi:hypothetical protein